MDSRPNGRHEGELLTGNNSFHGMGQPVGENRPYRGGKHRSTILRHDSPSTNFLFRRYHCCNSQESTEQYIDFTERHIATPQLYRGRRAPNMALIQFSNTRAASARPEETRSTRFVPALAEHLLPTSHTSHTSHTTYTGLAESGLFLHTLFLILRHHPKVQKRALMSSKSNAQTRKNCPSTFQCLHQVHAGSLVENVECSVAFSLPKYSIPPRMSRFHRKMLDGWLVGCWWAAVAFWITDFE
jgi:hypothetical protein